jgi:hypothetical protein
MWIYSAIVMRCGFMCNFCQVGPEVCMTSVKSSLELVKL